MADVGQQLASQGGSGKDGGADDGSLKVIDTAPMTTEEDDEAQSKPKRGASARKKGTPKGGKKGKKGMKRDASKASVNKDKDSKSPKNRTRMAADVVDTQTEEKLKRRLTEVLRTELVEEAEAKIREQLKAAKDAADQAADSKASLQRRTDKKIKALEDQVEEKDKQIAQL